MSTIIILNTNAIINPPSKGIAEIRSIIGQSSLSTDRTLSLCLYKIPEWSIVHKSQIIIFTSDIDVISIIDIGTSIIINIAINDPYIKETMYVKNENLFRIFNILISMYKPYDIFQFSQNQI